MYSLTDCLTRKTSDFKLPQIDNPLGYLYYQDNGSNVLGVCHLDFVGYSKPKIYGDYVKCTQLDDRLGAWILLNVLPSIGIKLDILLTDCEERGNSTAQYFYPDKKYNWVIEFDRAGKDIVFYQYGDFADYWPIREGLGSFSDISMLDHLGVLCANIGIGYYLQHTKNCYAFLPHTMKQVKRFSKFYHKYKDTRFPYSPPVYSTDCADLDFDFHYTENDFDNFDNWNNHRPYRDSDLFSNDISGEDYMDKYAREQQKMDNLYFANKRKWQR